MLLEGQKLKVGVSKGGINLNRFNSMFCSLIQFNVLFKLNSLLIELLIVFLIYSIHQPRIRGLRRKRNPFSNRA